MQNPWVRRCSMSEPTTVFGRAARGRGPLSEMPKHDSRRICHPPRLYHLLVLALSLSLSLSLRPTCCPNCCHLDGPLATAGLETSTFVSPRERGNKAIPSMSLALWYTKLLMHHRPYRTTLQPRCLRAYLSPSFIPSPNPLPHILPNPDPCTPLPPYIHMSSWLFLSLFAPALGWQYHRRPVLRVLNRTLRPRATNLPPFSTPSPTHHTAEPSYRTVYRPGS
ncbi:hypothetical protein CGRA01v4_00924 [Colletotrichum graminicola]|nr:hypothetical protein CGRA01v4_00924 [Colletotrichum graminicola]